ncbi:hypothetical protein Acr_13g0014620 [Actinidia rufa]|uniref:Uncharacterized protein n=1 Tax=Actinidia rufa TaxID=165716 RepID=A0A7J0FMV9_9ERIC|nr:hypothetical protein Acr_13g0014620 [Actinidia rufa]
MMINCRRLHPSVGAVRRNSDVQVILYLLTPLRIATGRCAASKHQRGYFMSLLNSDSPEVMTVLAWTAVAFGKDSSELWHEGPPSLLCSDSSAEISALARPMYMGLHRTLA